jgi:hypothetical protein
MTDRSIRWKPALEIGAMGTFGPPDDPNGVAVVLFKEPGRWTWRVVAEGGVITSEALTCELAQRACEAQALAWPNPIEGARRGEPKPERSGP